MGKSALWKLLSTVPTARLHIPFMNEMKATRTSQLKCQQSSCLCLLKSPPQKYTINAYNEEKWYSSTHTQRRHPMGGSGQLHGPWKASSNLCAEACWYSQPILTLRGTEKFYYSYRRSNPEHSVVQSLVLE
jgi:hypothetical protein